MDVQSIRYSRSKLAAAVCCYAWNSKGFSMQSTPVALSFFKSAPSIRPSAPMALSLGCTETTGPCWYLWDSKRLDRSFWGLVTQRLFESHNSNIFLLQRFRRGVGQCLLRKTASLLFGEVRSTYKLPIGYPTVHNLLGSGHFHDRWSSAPTR